MRRRERLPEATAPEAASPEAPPVPARAPVDALTDGRAPDAAMLRSLSRTAGNQAVASLIQRSKTKRRPKPKGPQVIEIAIVEVLPGDTSTTMMIRALLKAYGGRGMTDTEATSYAVSALKDHPAPGKRVPWKPGEEIPVNINANSKRFLDRKYTMRAMGVEMEDPEGPAIADGGEGGETADGSRRGTGSGDSEDREGAGNPEGSEGGQGAPGDEGVLEGGVSLEEGGATEGRVGAEPGGAKGGRRGGEGEEGDEGVRGALGWFPIIKVSEFLAPLVEVALILADAGAFDAAFSKLMKAATRAIKSQLKREAKQFAKSGTNRLARVLKEGQVPADEAAYITKLSAGRERARFYKELAERAESEHRRYAALVAEGGANEATLKHLTAQRDQAARIGREARALHLQEVDEANKLRGRDVTTGDPELDAQIDEAIGAAESPAVKGGKRPTVDGRPVPTKKGDRVDIDDVALRPGETQQDAVERIRGVIGRRISDTPTLDAWNAAREEVLAGRTIESLGQQKMNKEIYPKVRDRFWQKVHEPGEAREFLMQSGFDLGDAPAPLLRVMRDVPVQQIRISLDHSAEKALGKNWKKAIDADNLVFEFHDPNSYREIVQVRHRMREPGR